MVKRKIAGKLLEIIPLKSHDVPYMMYHHIRVSKVSGNICVLYRINVQQLAPVSHTGKMPNSTQFWYRAYSTHSNSTHRLNSTQCQIEQEFKERRKRRRRRWSGGIGGGQESAFNNIIQVTLCL